jgi:2-phospho-L-lactate guanylyltransferase
VVIRNKTAQQQHFPAAASAVPGCLALIAIKRRVECKSRLAGALPLPQRLALVRHMLAHVIDQCRQALLVGQIAVLSPERDAVPADIPVLADPGDDLNAALRQAQAMMRRLEVREWLILPADLPELRAADIDAMIGAGRSSGCALASDAAGRGTNALYARLPEGLDYRFGADSLNAHRWAATHQGWQAPVLALPGLAADVDTPDDLFRLDSSLWQRQLA